MDTTFIIAGIACLIAAVVGGGLKAYGFAVPILSSLTRQTMLGALGLIFLLYGMNVIPHSNSDNNRVVTEPIKQDTTTLIKPSVSDTPNKSTSDTSTEKIVVTPPITPPNKTEQIIVEASSNPYTVNPGEQAEIDVLCHTDNNVPVTDATVEIQSGGGFFSNSGTYTEIGTTNNKGVFKTYWKSPNPAAAGYGMSITARKSGFVEGKKELMVNISYR